MKIENEITVLVKCDFETLKNELLSKGFSIKEEYELDDIYMISNDIDLTKLSNLEILKKCVLIREIMNIKKVLLYKYKKFAPNGDIIEQGKVECPIEDTKKATEFMEAINYKKLFNIYDKCTIFANKETELNVQQVNNEYIFIEMEQKGDYIDRVYKDVEELKSDINRYNLPIDNSNYFVKKAELMLEKTLTK